jgi:Mn2+/Fe2+ NRAMP family transporter
MESATSRPSAVIDRLTNLQRLLKTLGPGILLAGAAIGASHVVQSTQAGARYGFMLLWVVILANLFKYPFFEYTVRYHHAMGKSMMDGYAQLGRLWLYIVQAIVVVNGLLSYAGVTIVTGALSTLILPAEILGRPMGMVEYTLLWQVISLCILVIGKYPWLDFITKLIIGFLSIATILAVVLAWWGGGVQMAPDFIPPEIMNAIGIGFLIALMGWMPAPIDVAIWPSLWAEEREAQTKYKPTRGEAMTDFNIGYAASTILAVFFLLLGALVMYGTGREVETSGPGFARQLVSLYTEAISPSAYWLIAGTVFATMFSTSLTCMDAFPRTADRGFQLCMNREIVPGRKGKTYWTLIIIYMAFTQVVAMFFMANLTGYITIAMTISFLTAPILAVLNFVIIRRFLPAEYQPSTWMNVLSYSGIVFLTGFALLFLYARLFW